MTDYIIQFQHSQPLSASTFSVEILDQTIRIISGVNSQLTEDKLLSASLFFTNTSEIAVRACTFITLGNNPTVQYRFVWTHLSTSALLKRGNAKVVEEGNDHLMVT